MSSESKQTLADSAANDQYELRVTDAAISADDYKGRRADRRRRSNNPARQPFANRGRNDVDVLKSVEVVEYLDGEPLGVVSWQLPLPTILSD